MHVKPNTSIVQANFFLENRPQMTLDETRLFLTIVGSINKDDEEFRPFRISVAEFADLWGIDDNACYRKIKEALTGLVNKSFVVEQVDKKTGKLRVFAASYLASAAYEHGSGFAIVEVSQLFTPYLLSLQNRYTQYVLKNILGLSSVNSIRHYELLKEYEGLGSRTFTIDDYRKILNIEGKYDRNTDLKRYVIDPAVNEINEKTDLLVVAEVVGRGKKAKIVFTIHSKEDKRVSKNSSESNNTTTSLPSSLPQYDPSSEDYTVNPKDLLFESSDQRAKYIRTYLENLTQDSLEIELFEAIPEEVHMFEINHVRAIAAIVKPYISLNFMDFYTPSDEDGLEAIRQARERKNIEEEVLLIATLERFNMVEYGPVKKRIQKSAFGYYKVLLEAWLSKNPPSADL